MILVIADDFSGAAEMAGMAFRHGLRARVSTLRAHRMREGLLAMDTRTRMASSSRAYQAIHALFQGIDLNDVPWMFKKVDSVLRGHVRLEIESILSMVGLQRALLIPANPSKGRIIVDGYYHIQGEPLHETFFARDPHYPRQSSSMMDLMGREGSYPVHLIEEPKHLNKEGILIPSIEYMSQVIEWANQAPDSCLMAGGVDFFEALLKAKGSNPESCSEKLSLKNDPPNQLFVCGSPGALAAGRLNWCHQNGIPVHECSSTWLASSEIGPPQTWVDDAVGHLQKTGRCLVTTSTEPLNDLMKGKTAGSRLVQIVRHIMAEIRVDQVFVEGGETALKLADAMGWHDFQVTRASSEGIPELAHHSNQLPTFIPKPGSYPWSDEWLVER